MRIKIHFLVAPGYIVPIEYNYNIYLNLRGVLLDYLKQKKPKLAAQYKKKFPEFTFSQLMVPHRQIELGFIKVLGNFMSLFVSAVDGAFVENLIQALYFQRDFRIFQTVVTVQKIEILEEPHFSEEMHFKMYSPLLLMQQSERKVHFVRPDDGNLNEVFRANLLERFARVYPGGPEREVRIQLNQDYLENKKVKTKLTTIRGIHYKSILSPFVLKGDTELIRFAYQGGIGDKTHYGFGMIEVRDDPPGA